MSEQKTLSVLEQTLVDAINSTKEGISKGIDFASEQLPEVIEQLIMWKMAEAIVWIVITFIALVVIVKIAKSKWDDCYSKFDAIGISMLLGIMPLIIFLVNVTELIKLIVAPKVYLLEYVSKLIN
jgi:hypothetical protein